MTAMTLLQDNKDVKWVYKTKAENVESDGGWDWASPTSSKQISSTYWFIREVLRDAPDAVIVSRRVYAIA
jgi:hypothetical protein